MDLASACMTRQRQERFRSSQHLSITLAAAKTHLSSAPARSCPQRPTFSGCSRLNSSLPCEQRARSATKQVPSSLAANLRHKVRTRAVSRQAAGFHLLPNQALLGFWGHSDEHISHGNVSNAGVVSAWRSSETCAACTGGSEVWHRHTGARNRFGQCFTKAIQEKFLAPGKSVANLQQPFHPRPFGPAPACLHKRLRGGQGANTRA